ncbi:TPA: hypothetical protein ACH3X2_001213 [Trebouxia sp. C0005]
MAESRPEPPAPAADSGHAYNQCPISTAHCASAQEMAAADLAELRAYKLGKRRWSYNECELVLHQDDECGPGNVLAAVGAVYNKESDKRSFAETKRARLCMKCDWRLALLWWLCCT